MNGENSLMIHIRRIFQASAEQLYRAWVKADTMQKFMIPAGTVVDTVNVDARVGGSYHLAHKTESGNIERIGEFLELDEPHRIVFTTTLRNLNIQPDTIIIDIMPLGTGCELNLVIETDGMFLEDREAIKAAWNETLDSLGRVLRSGG